MLIVVCLQFNCISTSVQYQDLETDDTNIFTLFTLESLRKIKITLSDFANISGVKCNYTKTKILRIGTIAPITDDFLELGFEWVDKIKVLGVDIINDLEKITENFIGAENKIDNMVKFWSKFNLSLPGRINIVKTFMLSQLGYLGSIVSPLPEQLIRIKKKKKNMPGQSGPARTGPAQTGWQTGHLYFSFFILCRESDCFPSPTMWEWISTCSRFHLRVTKLSPLTPTILP